MLHALNSLLVPALVQRMVLVVNHVIAAEPAAQQRLLPHAGRVLRLELAQWPALLPRLPALAMRITPAGLLEWAEDLADTGAADLHVVVNAANPAALALKALSGEPPALDIRGDAQLATDLDWLVKHLRWDVAADLERLFGPAVAHELHRLGRALARGLQAAVAQASRLAPGGQDK
jgi:ubiquinone biosynthesis protein UbiJ